MISSSRPLKVGVAISLLSTFMYVLSLYPDSHYYKTIQQLGTKRTYVEIAQATQIDDPYDLTPIRAVCDSTKWTDGIIISCGKPAGEIGEVRNTVLNCVRYAIESGAALVVPQIFTVFEDENTHEKNTKAKAFTHFFDLDHFLTSLTVFCPQMVVYPTVNDLWAFPTVTTANHLDPSQLFKNQVNDTLDANPGDWSRIFRRWVSKLNVHYTPALPILISLREPFLNFPTTYDSPEFIVAFGRILQFAPPLRALAAQIQAELAKSLPKLTPNTQVKNDTYLGVHLYKIPQTDRAAIAAEHASFHAQAQFYVDIASHHQLSVMYVATSRIGDMSIIKNLAKDVDTSIVGKDDLLPREALMHLTRDQGAAVDFEVLLKSSSFLGVASSLFAWGVALRRHVVPLCGHDREDADVDTNADADEGANATVAFSDGCSRLIGQRDDTFRWGVWP